MILEPGQNYVLRMSAPADAMTINGTLLFQEIGKV